MIENILLGRAKGLTPTQMIDRKLVPVYPFDDGGSEALVQIHRKRERSTWQPFDYGLCAIKLETWRDV